MPIERIRPRFLFNEERIEQLKQIAPECFADGKINWEGLKEALGNYAEDEGADTEHFGLFWPGKREARKLAGSPPKGTLVPVPGKGLDEENTRNIFIEGENLEVLKLLQKSYAGRIKMIYIDPPYNTGNDFVYDDNFTETIEDYLKRTRQIDEEGRKLTTNTRADGRFHSKWLSMMYPRLRLARNLLRDDGIIFVSIDDNEVHHLVSLLDEVFGQENQEGIITWRRRHNQPNDKTKVIGKVAEYIVVYSKNSDYLKLRGTFYGVPLSEKRMEEYKNPDNDPKGPWTSNPWKAAKGRGGSRYKLKTSTGKVFDEVWYGNEDSFKELLKDNRVHFTDNGNGLPRIKIYLSEAVDSGQSAINFFTHDKYGSNQEASAELSDLFSGKLVFNNPKPTKLIETLIKIATNENDIIMDFFAGSGSTAHAFFNSDVLENLKRQFVVVQIKEQINASDEAGKNAIQLGYKYISEVTLDRIIKSAKKIRKENRKTASDLGLKVFKLKHSNFKLWENVQKVDIKKLEIEFEKFESPLVDNWNEEDLLSEVMLLEGFPLDSKIEREASCKKNRLNVVSSDFCEHQLVVCLDKKVYTDTFKSLHLKDNDIFVCLDNAISDEQKVILSDKGLIKTI